MDEALDSVISKLATTWEECARLLEGTEDPDDHDARLSRMSMAFVSGALFLRSRAECEEDAASNLVTEAFSQIVRKFKPKAPSELDGIVLVHAPATISPEGVSLCQDWVIRYSAEPAPEWSSEEE